MDVLPRRLVGDIHEPVLGAAGNADDVARLRIEATTVHFVQVAALEDAKDLRLGMIMSRRPFPGALMVSMMENAPPSPRATCGQ
jgi:hypothetical protein